jgi:hypothetical protein
LYDGVSITELEDVDSNSLFSLKISSVFCESSLTLPSSLVILEESSWDKFVDSSPKKFQFSV